jgi:hypothetical protein
MTPIGTSRMLMRSETSIYANMGRCEIPWFSVKQTEVELKVNILANSTWSGLLSYFQGIKNKRFTKW